MKNYKSSIISIILFLTLASCGGGYGVSESSYVAPSSQAAASTPTGKISGQVEIVESTN